jgi:hypothetical protein
VAVVVGVAVAGTAVGAAAIAAAVEAVVVAEIAAAATVVIAATAGNALLFYLFSLVFASGLSSICPDSNFLSRISINVKAVPGSRSSALRHNSLKFTAR